MVPNPLFLPPQTPMPTPTPTPTPMPVPTPTPMPVPIPAQTSPPGPVTTPPVPAANTTPAPVTGPQAPPTPPKTVHAAPDTKLDALTAEYGRIKPELDRLRARAEELTKEIKFEAMQLAPAGATEAILRSEHLAQPYKISQRTEMRFDSKQFAKFDPATYARFTTPKVSWRMDPVR